MTREFHIDYSELKHGDEYEAEFMECHTPGPSCAVKEYVPENEHCDEEWRTLLYEDLRTLGMLPGEPVWIEIDY